VFPFYHSQWYFFFVIIDSELDTCTFALSSSQWSILSPPEISIFTPESPCIILSNSVSKTLISVCSNLWLSSYSFVARFVNVNVGIYIYIYTHFITFITNIRYHENKAVRTYCVMFSNYLFNVPVTSLLLDSAATWIVEWLPGRPSNKPFKTQRLSHSIILNATYFA